MSISKRFILFIGVWLLLFVGLEIYMMKDMIAASPSINGVEEAALKEIVSYIEPFGYSGNIDSAYGRVNLVKDGTTLGSPATVNVRLDLYGDPLVINSEVFFPLYEDTENIYKEIESIVNAFGESFDSEKEQVLETINIIKTDTPKFFIASPVKSDHMAIESKTGKDENGEDKRYVKMEYRTNNEKSFVERVINNYKRKYSSR